MRFIPTTTLLIVLIGFFALAQPILAADTDGDGLSDELELLYQTDSAQADTDGNGFSDWLEIFNGYSPLDTKPVRLSSIDSDSDGASDSWEIRLGLQIGNPDSDGDGYLDGQEISAGYDPHDAAPKQKEKRIAVDIEAQTLAYYFNNTQLEQFKISGGVASMPTPEGDFAVLDKVPTKRYGGPGFNFDYPNTKWNLHFTTGYWRYYIHGAYWHNNFGKPMSHGCVNVRYDQMERLYNFAQVGTLISIS